MKIVSRIPFFVVYLLLPTMFYAQETIKISDSFEWKTMEVQLNPLSEELTEIFGSDNSYFSYKHPEFPIYSTKFKLPSFGSLTANVDQANFENVVLKKLISEEALGNELVFHLEVAKERNEFYGLISFIPFTYNNGSLQALKTFSLDIKFTPKSLPINRTVGNTYTSKLSDGNNYKIAINTTGVHRLDYDFLKNTLGISNLDNIDPRNIAILGNGGGPLAEASEIVRIDDLKELPIVVVGESDGSFDNGDYILFYGEEADVWRIEENQYRFKKNIYDENNYYFVKIKSSSGVRMSTTTNPGIANYSSNSSDYLIRFEEDKKNLLGEYGSTQGSGQLWFGENFNVNREQNFSPFFVIPDYVDGTEVDVDFSFAGRSGAGHRVELIIEDQIFQKSISVVSTGNIEAHYAALANISESVVLNSGNPEVRVRYPESTDLTSGWLDYIQMVARRSAYMNTNQVFFQDQNSLSSDLSEIIVSNTTGNTSFWDITDPTNPKIVDVTSQGNQSSFTYDSSDELKRFIGFENSGYLTPEAIGLIENQNIHGTDNVDLAIIYHPDFETEMNRLADHRESHDNFNIARINIFDLYNEFSSGRIDPTSIRDFARMLYNRGDRFKYLLLFGDGSYDYKGIMPGLEFQSFVPVYETKESLDPIGGFPTDDFYGLLDEFEGDDLKGMLDIGVGRIPVRTLAEAKAVVDKIIHYDSAPETLGEWRVNIGFTADDEDNNIHLNQAESVALMVQEDHELFNQKKVYFDAFLQEATPGGQRYPDANEALNNNIFRGVLALNYLGHGGNKGWAQERVLQTNDIVSWENFDKQTLLVTATCSFTGYDDPGLTSAGELALFNENGGAVGLFSTVRAVYSFENKRLTESVYDTLFTRVDGAYMPLGEVLRRAKNQNWQDTARINARKFTLIGDPSMTLAIPEYEVVTTEINGAPFNPMNPDTLSALERVRIRGFIANIDGSPKTDFNGIIYPTLFDKESTLETLSNDEKSFKKQFGAYKNILFKGAATVSNGEFEFEFVVPKDINYAFGNAKISYYASDGVAEDAAGYTTDVIVGGTDPNAATDDLGPEITLFMNDEKFVYGGTTDSNPILLVKLKDDLGINISGTSIGHDLSGELDDDSQQSFIMNEFYEADVDDFTSGTARYPLKDLSPGLHKIKVKAWDVSNNLSEAIIEFRVLEGGQEGLNRVLNYPNPFTTNTCFQFEHDLPGSNLDILVQIYTLSGKLVKTIQHTEFSEGFRVDNVKWDGLDDYGSKLGKGIYLYKIKVFSSELNLRRESNFEKLAILR